MYGKHLENIRKNTGNIRKYGENVGKIPEVWGKYRKNREEDVGEISDMGKLS